VLHRSNARPEDNFFDLGGDTLSAASLLQELERLCNRKLPPYLIYYRPTLQGLAEILEQATLPHFPGLLTLKSGDEWPPVFIAPGMGANPLDYFQLARRIQSQHPIIVLQPRGFDRAQQPFDRIEDIAQYYLDAIKQMQAHGPYLLIGSSLGGLVTLEMAKRLTAEGEEIGLLTMLDSYPHFHHLSLKQRARLVVRLVKNHTSIVLRLPFRESISYIASRARRRWYDSVESSLGSYGSMETSISPAMQRIRDADYRALTRYKPRFYSGRIRFVRAAIFSQFPEDPDAVWGSLAEKFEAETVPGDHHGIITTNFESLAAVLSRYLREASL
jgi:thioesterase domain-containing protein